MSRLSPGQDVVQVKPSMNIYTGLTAVAAAVVIAGLALVYLAGGKLFDQGLLGGQDQNQTPAVRTGR